MRDIGRGCAAIGTHFGPVGDDLPAMIAYIFHFLLMIFFTKSMMNIAVACVPSSDASMLKS